MFPRTERGVRYVRGEAFYSAAWLEERRLFAESVSFEADEDGWTMVVTSELGVQRFAVAAHEILAAVRPLAEHAAEGDAARTWVLPPTAEDLTAADKPSLEGWEPS